MGTDQDQTIVWEWRSDAFGAAEPDTDPDNNGQSIIIENRFAGQYADQENGLRYNWHRYYDATKGRYISSDPIGLMAGLNTYGYVYQNTLGNVDTDGLAVCGGVCVGVAVATSWRGYKFYKTYKKWKNAQKAAAAAAAANDMANSNHDDAADSSDSSDSSSAEDDASDDKKDCPAPGNGSGGDNNDDDGGGDEPPDRNRKASESQPGDKLRTPDNDPDNDFVRKRNQTWENRRTKETWTRERVGRDHRGEKWDVSNRRGRRVADVSEDGTVLRNTR